MSTNKMLIAVIVTVVAITGVLFFYFANQDRSDKNISVLWPQSDVVLTNEHRFMAYVPDRALGTYNLYWKLNNGTWIEMEDSFDEIPHKALTVDTKNWESVDGKYDVEFIAKDSRNGEVLGRTSVVAKSADAQNSSLFGRMFAAAGAVGKNKQSSLNGFALSDLSVDWVTEGTKDIYDQQFDIQVDGFSPDQYYMFWQVGSSAYNRIFSENSDTTGVTATINFDSWSWRGNGPYELSFILQDKQGKEVGRKKINVYRFTVGGEEYVATTESSVVSEVVEEPVETEVPIEVPETPQEEVVVEDEESVVSNGSTLSLQDKELYVPQNKAAAAMLETDSSVLDTLLAFIADESQGIWLTGNTSSDTSRVTTAMSRANGELPVFVLYSIPNRDCGSYSAGGSGGSDAYLAWVSSIAQAASSGEAIFIVEPDALTHTSCLSASQVTERVGLVQSAVKILKSNVDSKVYIDIGHPYWLSVGSAADRLKSAGIEFADGFSLNTSNYFTTEDNVLYGNNIISRLALDGKKFVIDSGRNGVGPTSDNQWCNPSDRALGNSPQLLPGLKYVDAYLWVKPPGESDGTCNGGPVAGAWWLQQAVDLVLEMLEKETQTL